MMVGLAPVAGAVGETPAAVKAAVTHVAGMLWYEMLSALNQSGFSGDTLGTGGDDFQSMFLWNMAQNDFGKYDSQLSDAAVRQLSGADKGAAGVSLSGLGVATGAVLAGGGGLGAVVEGAGALDEAAGLAPAAGGSVAAGGSGAAGGSEAAGGSVVGRAEAYAKALWPQIKAAAQTLGVSPVAILAQSALETGWGAAAGGNNYFGIKAAPGQAGTVRPTHEVVDGVVQAQDASFRDYPSAQASVADYVGLIQSGYQGAVGQGSVAGFAQSLQDSGYATDRGYAAKIISISRSPLMQQVLQGLAGQSSGTISE